MFRNSIFRKLVMPVLAFALIAAFTVQSADAENPKWKEQQQALFDEMGLKPGETIDKKDWERIKEYLPESMVRWVKDGVIEMRIGAMEYDITHDESLIKDSAKNAGKYTLDEKKNLVEKGSGKPPLWMHGMPFPEVAFENDPDSSNIKKDSNGATKFIYNRLLALNRHGSEMKYWSCDWIGFTNGFERTIKNYWARSMYWYRPDGQIPNPGKLRYRDLTVVLEPFDVAGTAQLTLRHIDGSEDELYVYVPAIRRVKRMSGANRSDPYMGSDISVDEGTCWAGLTSSFKWTFVEERNALFLMTEWNTKHPLKMRLLPNGKTWQSPTDEEAMRVQWEDGDAWKESGLAPWGPANMVFVPRKMYVIKSEPLDAYYNTGNVIYWADKETYWLDYKVIWNRADEYWKTMIVPPMCTDWAGKHGIQHEHGYMTVDEKLKHATVIYRGGTPKGLGKILYTEFNNPEVNPRMFTVERLKTLTK